MQKKKRPNMETWTEETTVLGFKKNIMQSDLLKIFACDLR